MHTPSKHYFGNLRTRNCPQQVKYAIHNFHYGTYRAFNRIESLSVTHSTVDGTMSNCVCTSRILNSEPVSFSPFIDEKKSTSIIKRYFYSNQLVKHYAVCIWSGDGKAPEEIEWENVYSLEWFVWFSVVSISSNLEEMGKPNDTRTQNRMDIGQWTIQAEIEGTYIWEQIFFTSCTLCRHHRVRKPFSA